MKLALIGTGLILYAMFLTPAYFEPTDIVISTGIVAGAISIGIPNWLIVIWAITGYIALIFGLILIGHFAFRVKHPVIVIAVGIVIVTIIAYWAMIHGVI